MRRVNCHPSGAASRRRLRRRSESHTNSYRTRACEHRAAPDPRLSPRPHLRSAGAYPDRSGNGPALPKDHSGLRVDKSGSTSFGHSYLQLPLALPPNTPVGAAGTGVFRIAPAAWAGTLTRCTPMCARYSCSLKPLSSLQAVSDIRRSRRGLAGSSRCTTHAARPAKAAGRSSEPAILGDRSTKRAGPSTAGAGNGIEVWSARTHCVRRGGNP
jgi:hypothetical protein